MALKGNQKKLDKNNNNRIDAQDFKILKAEKAKDRGMGLQDEKVKPGKVMKARVGKSVQGTTAASANKNTFRGYQKVFDTGADRSTPKAERGVSTIVGVKPNSAIGRRKKKRVTYKSMDEMRQKTLGYKKGESTQAFKARKANENFAKQAAKATGLRGKAALAIAAAGVGAIQYLKSKMKKKKDEPKKKMGGGMMQKPMGYKEGRSIITRGGGVDSSIIGRLRDAGPFKRIPLGKSRLTDEDRKNLRNAMQKRNSRKAALDTAKRVTRTVASVASPVTAAASAAYKLAKKMKDKDRLTDRDIDKAKSLVGRSGSKNRPVIKDHSSRNPNPKTPKMMGGGMIAPSQRPGYSKGTMIKARGCKLGRTRPTKIT